MSFAREVKKEVLSLPLKENQIFPFLFGALHGIADVVITSDGMKVVMQTQMPQLLRYLIPHLRTRYQINPQIRFYEKSGIFKSRIYVLEITENIQPLVEDMRLLPWTEDFAKNLNFSDDEEQAFIRGSFVAKGSINDPKKSRYHAEILFQEEPLARLAQAILTKNEIKANVLAKNNQHLLYIKKAEDISSFLAYLQATSGVFYFADSRILRDLNNSVNRIMNCDIANGNKSLMYCQRQLEAIAYLEEKGYIAKLSPRLQDAIRLRKEYKDASLSELSELSANVLGKYMSKSGISHCLTEVMNFYEQLTSKSKDVGKVE
ncbi:MAG TPA: DNA-binding protein WhiA [Bacilli bacterium]|jgi:DNA-binding protein WhiA|nr:MAG: putative sporulation transcription regulator WhiA [Tenericutes bacterium ADurb.Bin140]HOE77219.1 DNA-binding protein WhiA [Bacilli bacterium]HON63615.1 DNA-binding protein WhiA [Bacilli bacterium]HOR95775.1 DNA-binding protein WhiA [Bacilli bacterium]HPD11990.1 DNA-binding protein WhiA [Bacilli bacterium]